MAQLPLEILTDVIAPYLEPRQVISLANLTGCKWLVVKLKAQANLILLDKHQTMTYTEIFRTCYNQPGYYYVALAAYQAITKDKALKDRFKYSRQLIEIGLALEDASVVAAGLKQSHHGHGDYDGRGDHDGRDSIIYQIYSMAIVKPAFRARLLKYLPKCLGFVDLWRVLQHNKQRYFQSQDLSPWLSDSESDSDKPDPAEADHTYLYEFFNKFQQDWVWPQLAKAISKPITIRTKSPTFDLASLTARYLGSVSGHERSYRAAILTQLNLLDAAMYALMLINQSRVVERERQQERERRIRETNNVDEPYQPDDWVPWYHDPIIGSQVVIPLSKIVEYGLKPGPGQWDIFELLSAIIDSDAIIDDSIMTKLDLLPQIAQAVINYVVGGGNRQSNYHDVILGVAEDCNLTTIVTMANQSEDLAQLRIRLLIILANKVARVHYGVNLTTELADLIITEDDLRLGLTTNQGWSSDDFNDFNDFNQVTHLLPWYQATTAKPDCLAAYIMAVVIDFIADGLEANVILYAMALRYGFNSPLIELVGTTQAWTGFANLEIATAWLERNYGLIDLERVPLSSDEMFGGISREALTIEGNIVEIAT